MTTTISNATTENLLTSTFVTDWENVFYNPAVKKFKESLSIDVTHNDGFQHIREVCNSVEVNKPFKQVNDGEKVYVKFNLSEEVKIFNTEGKEIKDDIEEVLKKNNARIIFTVRRYSMSGKTGLSFKCHQIQVKPKENRFHKSLFD